MDKYAETNHNLNTTHQLYTWHDMSSNTDKPGISKYLIVILSQYYHLANIGDAYVQQRTFFDWYDKSLISYFDLHC